MLDMLSNPVVPADADHNPRLQHDDLVRMPNVIPSAIRGVDTVRCKGPSSSEFVKVLGSHTGFYMICHRTRRRILGTGGFFGTRPQSGSKPFSNK